MTRWSWITFLSLTWMVGLYAGATPNKPFEFSVYLDDLTVCVGDVTIQSSIEGDPEGEVSYEWSGLPDGMNGNGSSASGTLEAGIYKGIEVEATDTGPDPDACDSDGMTLTVVEVESITGDTVVCRDEIKTYTATPSVSSGFPSGSPTWSVTDGTIQSGGQTGDTTVTVRWDSASNAVGDKKVIARCGSADKGYEVDITVVQIRHKSPSDLPEDGKVPTNIGECIDKWQYRYEISPSGVDFPCELEWSLYSGEGSITREGLYTPPSIETVPIIVLKVVGTDNSLVPDKPISVINRYSEFRLEEHNEEWSSHATSNGIFPFYELKKMIYKVTAKRFDGGRHIIGSECGYTNYWDEDAPYMFFDYVAKDRFRSFGIEGKEDDGQRDYDSSFLWIEDLGVDEAQPTTIEAVAEDIDGFEENFESLRRFSARLRGVFKLFLDGEEVYSTPFTTGYTVDYE